MNVTGQPCVRLTGNDTADRRIDDLLDENNTAAGVVLSWKGGDNVTVG